MKKKTHRKHTHTHTPTHTPHTPPHTHTHSTHIFTEPLKDTNTRKSARCTDSDLKSIERMKPTKNHKFAILMCVSKRHEKTQLII